MNEQIDTGALPASGRFARMEDALARIEGKLDQKVDVKDFARLEGRMSALETTIADAMSGKTTTALSQLYLQQFESMKKSIETLEDKDITREALLVAAKDRVDNRFRVLAAALGVLTAVSTVISVIALVT